MNANFYPAGREFTKLEAYADMLLTADTFTGKARNGGIRAMAKRWGWHHEKVRRFMQELAAGNLVKITCATKCATICATKAEQSRQDSFLLVPDDVPPFVPESANTPYSHNTSSKKIYKNNISTPLISPQTSSETLVQYGSKYIRMEADAYAKLVHEFGKAYVEECVKDADLWIEREASGASARYKKPKHNHDRFLRNWCKRNLGNRRAVNGLETTRNLMLKYQEEERNGNNKTANAPVIRSLLGLLPPE